MTLERNKRRGAETEIAVAEHARNRGFCHSHRRTRTGVKDCGDVFVNELVQSLECKATKTLDSAGFLREARAEAGHAGSPIPAAVWRPPGKGTASVGQFVALLPFDALLDLLERAQAPETTDVLWRSLWSRAMDDIDNLLAAFKAAEIDPPYVHCHREKELSGS